MIRFLVMDVDGTLTDGKIYMSNNGELFKIFDIKDGIGIHDIAISSGIEPVIITGRDSLIVKKRCDELGIKKVFQGVRNKAKCLENAVDSLKDVAYIGDDINDLECMNMVKNAGGVVGCPADAADEVVQIADFISIRKGGDGAVCEFIKWLIR